MHCPPTKAREKRTQLSERAASRHACTALMDCAGMVPATERTEQQRDACERMAHRFRWVDSFETVMQDAHRSRLARLAVAHPSGAGFAAAGASRPSARSLLQRPAAGAPLFDRKRAASGERADD